MASRSIIVAFTEAISEWIAKGEVVDRYFNPGDLFDDVHVLLTNDDTPDPEAVQRMSGRATARTSTTCRCRAGRWSRRWAGDRGCCAAGPGPPSRSRARFSPRSCAATAPGTTRLRRRRSSAARHPLRRLAAHQPRRGRARPPQERIDWLQWRAIKSIEALHAAPRRPGAAGLPSRSSLPRAAARAALRGRLQHAQHAVAARVSRLRAERPLEVSRSGASSRPRTRRT